MGFYYQILFLKIKKIAIPAAATEKKYFHFISFIPKIFKVTKRKPANINNVFKSQLEIQFKPTHFIF